MLESRGVIQVWSCDTGVEVWYRCWDVKQVWRCNASLAMWYRWGDVIQVWRCECKCDTDYKCWDDKSVEMWVECYTGVEMWSYRCWDGFYDVIWRRCGNDQQVAEDATFRRWWRAGIHTDNSCRVWDRKKRGWWTSGMDENTDELAAGLVTDVTKG